MVQKSIVALAAMCLFCDQFFSTFIIPIAPRIPILNSTSETTNATSPDHSTTKLSFLFTAKPLVQIFGNIIIGYLATKVSLTLILGIGLFVLLASSGAWLLFFSSYLGLLACRALQGLGSSAIYTGSMGLLEKYHKDDLEEASGMAMLGLALGVNLGPTVGGIFWDLFQKYAFLVVGVFILLTIFIFVYVINKLHLTGGNRSTKTTLDLLKGENISGSDNIDGEEMMNHVGSELMFDTTSTSNANGNVDGNTDSERTACESLMAVYTKPELFALFMCHFATMWLPYFMEPTVPIMIQYKFGYSATIVALIWSCTTGGYVLGMPFSGWILSSHKVKKTVAIAIALLIGGLTVVLVGLPTWLPNQSNLMYLLVMIPSLLLIGASISVVEVATPSLVREVLQYYNVLNLFPVAIGIPDIAGNVAGIFAPLVPSLVSAQQSTTGGGKNDQTNSSAIAFFISGGLAFVCAFLGYYFISHIETKNQQEASIGDNTDYTELSNEDSMQ
eukprot:g4207.t1